ncbi:MAG: hypothetical protein GAK30_01634 [Paracidovorax wautersii]|uniref:Integral membrane protein, YjbE family n=1 Tax=Paracidovorax wautersii TaxID=1177982 RepID=A0A7V8FPJ1_9BURK|nr:MAG: hypothetical protein GAK30_01634 [Paracidovorax wautersii]
MEFINDPQFWIGLIQIVWINIILSGDNAVVIALAARSLPPAQQRKAVLFGSGAAVVLRIALTVVAAKMMALPFLQIVGGALLLWIGLQLFGNDEEGEAKGTSGGLLVAVRTILIADLVMSLDNVIAIAGAAQGAAAEHHLLLVVFGLVISIPIIIWGSQLVIKLMDRFPVIITLGAMLLGWIAGTMLITDQFLIANVLPQTWLDRSGVQIDIISVVKYTCGIVGALLVLAAGKALAARKSAATPE